MNHRIIWLAVAVTLAPLVCLPCAGQGSETVPNIVLIVADDLGYGDVGCYGSTINKTPHIDALAAGGLRFTDFHSAGPMCSPTRAAMLTGQYQQRFGRIFDAALSGTNHRDRGLPNEAVTIAELLQQRNYATACFGKWHLGYKPPWLPPNQGFDQFRGLASGDGDFHTHVDRSGNPDWWRGNTLEFDSGYTTDLLTKYSLEFIEQRRDQPFFLYVPHLAIHFPWQGPSDPPHRQPGRSYHDDKWGIVPNPANVSPHVTAMIESIDDSVGKTVAALRKWKLEQNTIVMFTSDNGGYLNYGSRFQNISSNGRLRGQKTELYEGGHRVPTIISWPGRIAAGVTDELGHSTDLLPTFAKLAGIPDRYVSTDGSDLSPLLFRGQSLPQRSLFWRAGSEGAVRSGPWKLVVERNRTELYNLDEDLGERRNLANERTALVDELKGAWSAWETEMNHSAKRYE
jgi:arylsulfatase A-like enzyme